MDEKGAKGTFKGWADRAGGGGGGDAPLLSRMLPCAFRQRSDEVAILAPLSCWRCGVDKDRRSAFVFDIDFW